MSTSASESAIATVGGNRKNQPRPTSSQPPDERHPSNRRTENGSVPELGEAADVDSHSGGPSGIARQRAGNESAEGDSPKTASRKRSSPPRATFASLSNAKANEPRFQYATAGDHAAVHNFLTTVFQGPPRDAFLATLDDPFYEPSDRLLIKLGHRLLAHAHVTKRIVQFGPLTLPVAGLHWLATSPEFRGRGFGSAILKASHKLMVEDGSILARLDTREPYFFRSEGWAVCGRRCHSSACTRDLLSQLGDRDGRQLSIRPWRQVELPGVMRIFRRNTAETFGPVERTEAYWRWLVSRRGFDQLFVAIAGPDRLDIDEDMAHIVGYMITKQDHILELFAEPDHPEAIQQMLARGCSDAIERDYHHLTYHGSPNDGVHGIFRTAGGSHRLHESYNGEVSMVKVFDPLAILRRISPMLHRRATVARLNRPSELGLVLEGQKLRLKINPRGVRVSSGKIGRSHITCNMPEFTRLIMGHVDVTEVLNSGRLEASTQVAMQIAAALFPPLPQWRPPMDELVL